MKKFIISFFLVIVSCQNSENYNINHPTQENLSSNESSKVVLINESSKGFYSREILGELENENQIGTNYEKEKVFGFISDVKTDKFNRIYILDERQQLIQVFDKSGKFIKSLGGRGRGPDEYENAKSIANYKNELLIVGNGYRIEIYDISSEAIKYQKSVILDNAISSLCIVGDKLFMNRLQVIHPTDSETNISEVHTLLSYSIPEFEELGFFGEAYTSNNTMVVDRMSVGKISCNEKSKVVIFSFEKMPIIHGYSSENGKLLWKSKIEDISLFKVLEKNEGGRTRLVYEQPENRIVDNIRSSISVNEGFEILQIDRRILGESEYETKQEILSFLVNSKNGWGELINEKLPLFMYLSKNRAFTVSEDYTSVNILSR